MAGESARNENSNQPITTPLPELQNSPESSIPPGDGAKGISEKEDEHHTEVQYVTGIKLVLVVTSVALACFLMLVDTMVISTVSTPAPMARTVSTDISLWYQAIPRITDEFRSLPDVGWYAGAYQFGM